MDYKEKYEAWRNSPHVPETVKFELNELAGDDRELRLRFAQDLKFGTAGLRGLLGAGTNRMNLCTVGWITAGIAKYMLQNRLDRRGVVIGRDSRLFSRDFAEFVYSVRYIINFQRNRRDFDCFSGRRTRYGNCFYSWHKVAVTVIKKRRFHTNNGFWNDA